MMPWKNSWSNTLSKSILISGLLSTPSSLLWKLSADKSPHSSNNKINFASIWRKEFTPQRCLLSEIPFFPQKFRSSSLPKQS